MNHLSERSGQLLHQLKNHLSIVVGFCDLLISEMPESDSHHADAVQIRAAARDAMALVPELSREMK
jgi:hypothetical protein